jgi:hypothetical protein
LLLIVIGYGGWRGGFGDIGLIVGRWPALVKAQTNGEQA